MSEEGKGGPLFPVFAPVARLRPVDVVQPGTSVPRAPFIAAAQPIDGDGAEVALTADTTRISATWDEGRVALGVDLDGVATQHRSRRHGRSRHAVELALSLTGPVATAWVREGRDWRARAQVDLADEAVLAGRTAPPVHDADWLADVVAHGPSWGAFGQLGLRDARVVTEVDGSSYREPGASEQVLFTATSAGPGGFRTGHTSVWSLDPATLALEHRGDLFVRRPGADGRPGVYGDHATHLVRDGGRWLVATSTWGDFDRRRHPQVDVVLAETDADLMRGTHVLDAVPLPLPTGPGQVVGVWDPHLVRDGERWLVAFVGASRFFRFHPMLAEGPALDRLSFRAAATGRHATEGPTLIRADGAWWLLASDGRDNPREHRERYPVFDLDLVERGRLGAHYPTNIPWPTLAPYGGGAEASALLLGFDGEPAGGALLPYGSHGSLVVQRPVPESMLRRTRALVL
ncbi:hypothetical protein [Nocardioides sp. R-C-SC26]|uniref:hypothetical protein n=1 Tax=Nocardioides sp. R-C-SC26 TaxID=2870414 RepID=UPI001E588B4A|nr:hypothetical protein [Nocardioides sp. R-C-SC26]